MRVLAGETGMLGLVRALMEQGMSPTTGRLACVSIQQPCSLHGCLSSMGLCC